MEDLIAARLLMAMSLAFHILFAVVGMAMPVLMVVAEGLYARTGREVYLELAKRWSKGVAVFFAVGAVSGTVLSFELGLLWPRFMEKAGPLIGLPFSYEGFAFFLEAIFLGIYLYGWDRVPRAMHIASGALVAVSGLAGGIFVVAVNSWMNTPAGFTLEANEFTQIDPYRAFFNPAFPTKALHVSLSAYVSVGFAVAGIHASRLLRHPSSEFHRAAVGIAFAMAAIATPLQMGSGDLSAKHIARFQPVKLAAAEGLFETTRGAPLSIGGIPDREHRELNYAIEIPYLLSVLAFADPDAEVRGLNAFPEQDWPPLLVTHLAFQVMIGCGTAMLAVVGLGGWVFWRQRELTDRRFLKVCVLASPLGVIALEAGWCVTEVGRQPWIIHGIMRTAEAVTPMPHLVVPLAAYTLLYLVLGVVVVRLLRAHVLLADEEIESFETPAAESPENDESVAFGDPS